MDNLQKIKELYLLCFPEETEEYIDFFLKEKYDGTNCTLNFDGDTLINILFFVRKKMHVRGATYKTFYLVAGGTHPDYRAKGLFKQVMIDGLERVRSQGMTVTGLMPFKTEYYEKLGFVTHSFVEEVPLKKGKTKPEPIEESDIADMQRLYDTFLMDKNVYFPRGREEFLLRLREVQEDGNALKFVIGGETKGYILSSDGIWIDEYVAEDEDVIFEFDTGFESVGVKRLFEGDKENMFRVVDCFRLLGDMTYCCSDRKLSIEVVDKVLPSNSGKFCVDIKKGKAKVEYCEQTQHKMTIEQFNVLVAGCYESGTFGEDLEEVFPPMVNCAFEKF